MYMSQRRRFILLWWCFDIPALTVGDPHLTTLDGYTYTFNGIGEFVYLKTNDDSFQSQIRFEQFRDKNGINNITKCAFWHKLAIDNH